MFYEEFRRVSNGVGFPRCAERRALLDELKEENRILHKRIDNLGARFWWAISTSLVTLAGFVLSLLKGGTQ